MDARKAALLKKPAGAPKSAQDAPAGAGGAVAVQKSSTAVALPAELAAELAAAARQAAALERPKVSKISLRAGIMQYMQQEVPGNSMEVVVLACAFRNTWYAGSFDPDNIVNPNCFAVAVSKSGAAIHMAPHPNVKEPVHPTCEGCPKAQWGTATRDGKPSRGKACKEGRRIIVMPASALEGADSVKSAELALMDIPVTSVNNWATFVNTVASTVSRPFWGVLTRVEVKPNVRSTFVVVFIPIDVIQDAAVITAVRDRIEEAERLVSTPFDETELMGEKGEKVLAPAKKSKFTR